MRLTSCRTKNEFKEWAAMKIAWALPRSVALWAMVRVAAHSKSGPWGNEYAGNPTYKEMHDRWSQQHG